MVLPSNEAGGCLPQEEVAKPSELIEGQNKITVPTALEDSVYGKYFRMVKAGVLQGAVAKTMLLEGAVQTQSEALSILSMDPDGPAPAPKKCSAEE